MIDWERLAVVERYPESVNDDSVFHGIRAPVVVLFENRCDSVTLEQFLRWVVGVVRTPADAVLGDAASLYIEV